MRRVVLMFACATLMLAGCQHEELFYPSNGGTDDDEEPTQSSEESGNLLSSFTWNFPGVAQEVVESARASYEGATAPAVIIYVDENERPKSNFKVQLSGNTCNLPVSSDQSEQSSGAYATSSSGFVFLTAEQICGNGEYHLDLRQGTSFDRFCGPNADSFTYGGSPTWVSVEIWCE